MKSIFDLLKDESFFKDLVDMLFSFLLQVAKKDGIFYSPTKYVVFPFKNSTLLFAFANMF
jgi:hypothetical protein